MFSDDEIKESYMRPGDEIISIQEVCLSDKFDKRDLGFKGEALLNPGKNDLDVPFFFPEGLEHPQARFAWTEEDGNITALVSEPGFGTTGQMTFGKDLEAALKNEEVSSSSVQPTNRSQQYDQDLVEVVEPHIVSSTSSNQFGSERSKPLTCKVDKADPRSRYHFVKYIKRHGRTVKLWECSICNREFQHQYTLMRHLPTHTDERNFHCDSCGKSFRQLSTLSQHRAIHSAERPYSCEVCSKTFNRVSTLISHRKTHSDKKPYKCHFCPKGFHQKGNLRNHLFTHTNERPYRCNVCQKGFNQQSNLVCHKNKAHPDDPCPNSQSVSRERKTPRIRSPPKTHVQPDSTITIPPVDHCEVSSSVGPYHPSMEGPSSSTWPQPTNPTQSWPQPPNLIQNWPKPSHNWTQPQHQIQTWIQAPKQPQPNPTPEWSRPNSNEDWTIPRYIDATDVWSMPMTGNGVIVDPIKTYHMGVALATRQTPFALLKPDNGVPVLVKVVDTKLPGGKQMLVPATAEDLRIGGKLVLNNDGKPKPQNQVQESDRAVQIRVPVVATVVPKIQPGGRLHLAVEEPHHAYHAATHGPGPTVGPPRLDTCNIREMSHPRPQALRRLDPPPLVSCPNFMSNEHGRAGGSRSSSYTLPPPALSPPLDLISMDLFEPMECIPMGPQITAVDNINYPPSSDDSDIFIGEFEISGKSTTMMRVSNFRAGQSLDSVFEDRSPSPCRIQIEDTITKKLLFLHAVCMAILLGR